MWTGIDIGSYSIKIIQVVRTFTGEFKVMGAARALVPAEDSSGDKRAENTILSQMVHSGAILPRRCVIGVTGRELNLRTTLVAPIKSAAKFQKLMEYELNEIAGKSAGEVDYDFARLKFPEKKYAENPVLVGLVKKTWVAERTKSLRTLGISVNDIHPEPLALMSAYQLTGSAAKTETVLLMDIGANNINVVISQRGNLIFARNLSGGGNNFTDAIKEMVGVSREQAELLKMTEVNLAMAHRNRSNPLNAAALSSVGQLHSLIQSVLTACRSQLRTNEIEIDRVLLSGGGARVPGLATHLTEIIGKPVEIFNPFQQVNLSALPEESRRKISEGVPDMVIALGLALNHWARGDARISLLPHQLKQRKRFLQETIYTAAGLIILVLALVIVVIKTFQARETVQFELSKLTPEQTRLTELTKQFNQVKQEKELLQQEYQAYLAYGENSVFFANTLMIVSQLLPEGIWVSDMTLGHYTQGDSAMKTTYDPNAIELKGYLQNEDSLSQLDQFYNNLNNNTIYPLHIIGTKDLTRVEGASTKGKWEFKVVITKGMDNKQ